MTVAPKRANVSTGHLVGPLRGKTVSECYRQLQAAHDYLAAAGLKAIEQTRTMPIERWGTHSKRIRVCLKGDKPPCIGTSVDDHNLVEVINQCATLERLLDVLEWARQPDSGLSTYDTVIVCHPSTSSSTDGEWENDLVLRTRQGQTARFEVSDVASATNSNGKREKDLKNLRILHQGCAAVEWPANTRLFVVVSGEFSSYLLKSNPSWKETAQIGYHLTTEIGTTRVLEIFRAANCKAVGGQK